MASFTIIPYNPIQANANHRPRAKYVFKPINDHDKGLRIKPSILPIDAPQPQAIAVDDGAGGLTTREKDSDIISNGDQGSHDSVCTGQSRDQACGQKSEDKGAPIFMGGSEQVSSAENNDIQIELDSLFDETDAEPNVGGAEVQDSDAGGGDNIESGMREVKTTCHLLKRKAKTGGQGSKDNPLVNPESDTESEDGLVWKKRKVDHSLVGHQVPWLRMVDETDDEADSVTSEIRGSEDNEQSHPHPAASSARHSDFSSTLSKSTDLVERQSFARVGSNSEWGIHGIIGKEVIEGKVYYCVDWEPTMIPLDDLLGAERLVQEFEAKEQARRRERGDTQKRKYRSWYRK